MFYFIHLKPLFWEGVLQDFQIAKVSMAYESTCSHSSVTVSASMTSCVLRKQFDPSPYLILSIKDHRNIEPCFSVGRFGPCQKSFSFFWRQWSFWRWQSFWRSYWCWYTVITWDILCTLFIFEHWLKSRSVRRSHQATG